MLEKIILRTARVIAMVTLVIALTWELGCIFGKPGIMMDELDWVIFSVLNLTIVNDYLIFRLNEEYDEKIYLRKELNEEN